MKCLKRSSLIALAVVAFACSPSDETELKTSYLELPAIPYPYKVGDNDNIPTLGRVLFYDKQLSVNNSVSCSSCHKQSLAFADNVAFSKGFENRLTSRNSMPIQNLASDLIFFGSSRPEVSSDDPINSSSSFFPGSQVLFWDGRETSLQSMVLKPIGNHVEMGIRDMKDLSVKLATVPYYKDLFKKAFGSDEINSEKIAQALSSFLRTITSSNTKFDRSFSGKPGDHLTALETAGRQLFMSTYDCNACHQVQSPHGYIFAGTFSNIGLDAQNADNGLEAVTKRSDDAGKFKIPSLRNVELTAPYMHDGRFNTLEEVLGHYSEGIADNPNLDERLRNDGAPMRMEIPEHDKKAIVAFLRTLTDHAMITDPKFSNPFKAR